MKEQDYINATDIRAIMIAKDALKHICAENSSVIDNAEYVEVVRIISEWEIKLFEVIEGDSG